MTRLLDATAKLVAREGAAAVTIREVARLAGVSHNAPYRHFESLSALLAAVATEGFAAFRERLSQAVERAKPQQRRRALGQAYLDFALENPRLYLLMFGPELDRTAHPELKDAADAAFAVLTGETARSAAKGAAYKEAIAAWAFVHGLAHLIIDKQIKRSDPVIADLFGRG